MSEEEMELLSELEDSFRSEVSRSKRINDLKSLLDSGRVNYKNALDYSDAIAIAAMKTLDSYSDRIVDDADHYNALKAFIKECGYGVNAEYAAAVQEFFNQKNGIGINVIIPEVNYSRISGLSNKINNSETRDEILQWAGSPLQNLTNSVVDDYVVANARFQHESGVDVKVVRIRASDNDCEFCDRLAGVYGWRSEKSFDSFDNARHENCKCIISVQYDRGFKQYRVPSK